ncbi:MAG: T9SS type A sorting domain-containing protein [Bacteroidales bacterium]|nr:T9SS type A sorting domain-containing protein [Bacteroidales bacterium]
MKKITLLLISMSFYCLLQAQIYVAFSYTTPPIPVADAGNDTTVTEGVPFQLTGAIHGGTAPFMHYWSPGLYLDDSTLLHPTVILSQGVSFTLFVLDDHGCEATDQVSINVIPDGIPSLEIPLFHLYPNPNSGQFTIDALGINTDRPWAMVLRNHIGRVVYKSDIPVTDGSANINLPDIATGMYLIEIIINGQRTTQKIVIQ